MVAIQKVSAATLLVGAAEAMTARQKNRAADNLKKYEDEDKRNYTKVRDQCINYLNFDVYLFIIILKKLNLRLLIIVY